MVALLQPAPETYELFDDVLLLSDGAMGATFCRAPDARFWLVFQERPGILCRWHC